MSDRAIAHETRWSRLAVSISQLSSGSPVDRKINERVHLLMAEIEKEIPVLHESGERIEGQKAIDFVAELLTEEAEKFDWDSHSGLNRRNAAVRVRELGYLFVHPKELSDV